MNLSCRKVIQWILILSVPGSKAVFAQSPDSLLLHHEWNARWITVPGESSNGYGVYLFRKILNLSARPESLVVNVSADNRYKLFVNGTLASLGPARGDLEHWNFETLDIAPLLHSGKNIIAAEVWNEGEWRPEGQISLRTGFILQGNNNTEETVHTDSSWKCTRDSSHRPIRFITPTYYVAGAGELINMNEYCDGWEKPEYADSLWQNAQPLMAGIPKNLIGGYGTVSEWMLTPSILPSMELTGQRINKLVKSEGVKINNGFPYAKNEVVIPSHTDATIILDQGFLTNSYPQIIFSGGKGGTISLRYAEALFSKYPSKGNRNETERKIFLGRQDSIISNGKKDQIFVPLTFRTYRYVQVVVRTQSDPFVIKNISGTFTGYPFRMNSAFHSDDPGLTRILETGWRTARLCAMETYMDCPYYEQLQYIGDTRIQALVSFYNSGDERLLRKAMNDIDNSRRPEGVTLSRHPSYTPQYIPTFSFWYIGMLHDYMMYGRDSNFIKNKLAGERQVMQYFRKYQQADGSLKNVPFWMFTDWVEAKGWTSGAGPTGRDGCSSLVDLQLLWAYELAADLESGYGMESFAALYREYAVQLKKTIRMKYWSPERNLFADRMEKDLYSQHANTLAILTGMFDQNQANAIGKQLLSDSTLAQASIYFKFYLHSALVRAGLGNDYVHWLGLWLENLNLGLTTWAEISDINNARSDCHAWGASPNIEFFRTILGIDSDAPGFNKVKIEPWLGQLKNVSGEIPHPSGKIKASYRFENGKWIIRIDLPGTTTGNLVWKNKFYILKAGTNQFIF